MKKLLYLILIPLFLITLLACTDDATNNHQDLVIDDVILDETTLEPRYALSTFDLSTIELTISYTNDTEENIQLEERYIFIQDLDKLEELGSHSIRVDYQGYYLTMSLTLDDSLEDYSTILDIYYLNDLHGALLKQNNSMGLAYIGNYLINAFNASPESTLFLSGGDMVQGSLMSNDSYGESTTKILDMMYMDAAVVGNHEFDWGLEMVTRYYTGDADSYNANHPLLGANIIDQSTNDLPNGVEPYTVIERDGITIGIIGVIGYGLESSISTLRVEGYAFLDPAPIVKTHAKTLRSDYNADVVIVITHGSGESLAQSVSYFSEDAKVDAVLYGHSHRVNEDTINGVPIMISGANGSHLGKLQLMLDDDNNVVHHTISNLTIQDNELFMSPNESIDNYINALREDLSEFYEPLLYTNRAISRDDLTEWMATLMKEAAGVDVGFQNRGGTRASINSGEGVSIATLMQIFPFDNQVITATITGADLISLEYNTPNKGYNTNYNLDDTFTLATSDYIFYHEANNLYNNETIEVAFHDMRDLAIEELLLQAEHYDYFDTNNPLLYPNTLNQD